MAYVFRQKRRKPIPAGAEILRRKGGKVARWKTENGRTMTADVDGDSIITEGAMYRARWRDASGVMHTESTGCRTLEAAKEYLALKVADVERIKAGVVSQAEADTAAKSTGLIDDALTAFADYMQSRRRTSGQIGRAHV